MSKSTDCEGMQCVKNDMYSSKSNIQSQGKNKYITIDIMNPFIMRTTEADDDQETVLDGDKAYKAEALVSSNNPQKFSDAVKVRIIDFIHQSSPMSCTSFISEVKEITPTYGYTVRDIVYETFGRNGSNYIQFEYEHGYLKGFFLKNPWKRKPLLDILDSLNLSKDLVKPDVPKNNAAKSNTSQNSHKMTNINVKNELPTLSIVSSDFLKLCDAVKVKIIEFIHQSSPISCNAFISEVKQITPTYGYTVHNIIFETFGKDTSHNIQFEYKGNHVKGFFLKNPWKTKSLLDILVSLNLSKVAVKAEVTEGDTVRSRTSPAVESMNTSSSSKGNVLAVLSKKDKLLIIDLIKKGSKTFEVFKAEADSLVASSKLTDFHGLMVSLFGDFIQKYVSLENGLISLRDRFKQTHIEGILDSIKQTIRHSFRRDG